jgi:two-component system, OmpR family, alkaline phosphatase synthesis response regulator PhoP
MARETILVIEDEKDIQELIRFNLERDGYKVVLADSAEAAARHLARQLPAVLLLDLMLPGENGFDFCRKLRGDERTRQLPVIMVTARDEDADIVAGLEVGADDYITKPFSPRVLLARVRAVLRRRAVEPGDSADLLTRGPLEIDRAHHAVRLDGQPAIMTLSEFRILELLMRRPGVVFSRYQIVDAVHGSDYPVTDRSVDVQIVGLRRKLGRHSELIETVRGVGYRFRVESAGE